MSGTPLKGGPKLVTPDFFYFPTPKKGPKWAQKYPILLGELLQMAITTFPAILSQIGDGSIFVKISKGVYPLQIFTKIDPSQIWLKIAGKVVYAISSNSTNKIGYF